MKIKQLLNRVTAGSGSVVARAMPRLVHTGRAIDRQKILARMLKISAERPLDINVETTNFCAASCVFCPNSKAKRHKSIMSMTLFQKICDEYASLGGGAFGISSMQSDLFSDSELLSRIQYLQKYKDMIYLYATTYLVGASKLNDVEMEFLLRSFDYLQVSLGGTDKASYRRMYGINGYDAVRNQLLRIKKIVDQKDIDIKLALYFRTEHPEEIPTSDLIKELGSTFCTTEVRNEFFSWGGIISQADLPEGARLVVADNSLQQADCAVASATMSINVDGSVVGCGCVDWNAKHVVGNVQVDSVKQVWQSKKALEFRRAFSTYNMPDLCKDCSLYISVDDAFSRVALRNYEPKDGLYYNQ